MSLKDRTPPTEAQYNEYRTRYSNWGRWGEDDNFGTLNFITTDTRNAAARLVQEGVTISCSRPFDTQPSPANRYPAQHYVVADAHDHSADFFSTPLHGLLQTHIDALCHLPIQGGGQFWNGKQFRSWSRMPQEETGTVDFWRSGIVTRGVLYDIPALRGEDYVAPGSPVQGWELQDAADRQGVQPRSGDAVLLRSGRAKFEQATGKGKEFAAHAGVHASVVEFLYETEASLLIWDMVDAPVEDQGLPNPVEHTIPQHVHHILLPYMGMPLVDHADLELVAAHAAESGRYEFMSVVSPLYLKGATGSPVNPLAIF